MLFCNRRLLSPPVSPTDIQAAFKVLGVVYSGYGQPAALSEQVRKNYRELARLHHPDLSSGDDNRMKMINTAYELIQSSGVLRGASLGTNTSSVGADMSRTTATDSETAATASRFRRKAGSRRHRMPDDFASGDVEGGGTSSSSWSMRSSLDWQSLMTSTETLTKEELSNAANHPFSHSRFFTFDEDVSIYKMIRGGATVPQVARTLGKPATFVEKRLHNAQFKLRIQYVLRGEKRAEQRRRSDPSSKGGKHRHGADQPDGLTPSAPSAPNAQERLLHRGERQPQPRSKDNSEDRTGRRREWEPTMPQWQAPQYFAKMSLEEKGRYAKLLREATAADDMDPLWGTNLNGLASGSDESRRRASKLGKSYANYARLQPGKLSTRIGK